MFAIYKTRFMIEPDPPGPLSDVAAECLGLIEGWVARSFGKGGMPFPGVSRCSDIDRESHDPQLRSLTLDCGAFLHSFYWGRRPETPGAPRWVSAIDLVSDGAALDFQFQLGVETEGVLLAGEKPTTGTPRLIATILTHPQWRCRSGAHALSVQPTVMTMHDVESFCNDVLFAAGRELPLVLLTPRQRSRFPVSPSTLAQRLGGLARTVQLRDSLTVRVLDDFLGRQLAIGLDAVRVFAPGITPGAGLADHWHFLGETIRAKRLTDIDFSDFLFGRLAERALARFRQSRLIARFFQLAEAERTQKLEAAKHESTSSREMYEQYTRELEAQNSKLAMERRDLESLAIELSEQIEILQRDLKTARENLAQLSIGSSRAEVDHAETPVAAPASRTVRELVRECAATCADLEFLPSAYDSAEDVPVTYKFPDRVANALKALQKGAAKRRHTGRMEGGWRPFFEAQGFEYKAMISNRTRNTWGDDYTFLFEGRREMFEEHFTIGVHDANTCLSIHFSTKLRQDKIVVAYVGRHLRNTQS